VVEVSRTMLSARFVFCSIQRCSTQSAWIVWFWEGE
jgi:hypothetical protein